MKLNSQIIQGIRTENPELAEKLWTAGPDTFFKIVKDNQEVWDKYANRP